jgi:hypothetical protein
MNVEERPVLSGLVALVAVAVVVGLVAGFAALAGSRIVGLGGETEASGSGSGPHAGETLELPRPSKTQAPTGPLVTLAPGDERGSAKKSGDTSDKAAERKRKRKGKKEKQPESVISLSASKLAVSQMGRIDLTGTFPGGEGSVLRVQRREDGTWQDFPVTVSVSNETFSTYVQSGTSGPNKFRVKDTDSDKVSNAVTVKIG